MADLNDFDKPDNASNFNTEVHQTNRGNVARAISLDWGSALNVPVGAKRLTEPSAGDIVIERKTSGGQVTIFDSRDKLNKVGDQALVGQLDIKGVDSTTRHKRLRFLRYDGQVMATMGESNLGTSSGDFVAFNLVDTTPGQTILFQANGVAFLRVIYPDANINAIAQLSPYGTDPASSGRTVVGDDGGIGTNYKLTVASSFAVIPNGQSFFALSPGFNAGAMQAYANGTHYINQNTSSSNAQILWIGNAGAEEGAARFYTALAASNGYGNALAASMRVARNTASGRSINAQGTINASGADYAEYHRKAPGCGLVAKGEIVGIDARSCVTQRFREAVRFAIKSTDPSYVGGDVWGSNQALGMDLPERPQFNHPPYVGPANAGPVPDGTKAQISAWRKADRAFRVAFEQYQRERQAAEHTFENVTLPEYEQLAAVHAEKLESARAEVDRIAYSGQVPCNVLGAEPGDYIVVGEGRTGEIEGFPVPAGKITFENYKLAVMRVTQILDDNRAFGAVIVH